MSADYVHLGSMIRQRSVNFYSFFIEFWHFLIMRGMDTVKIYCSSSPRIKFTGSVVQYHLLKYARVHLSIAMVHEASQ